MQILIPALFLLMILSLLSARLQATQQERLRDRPARVFLAPAFLTLLFWLILGYYAAFSAPLAMFTVAYTFLPTICSLFESAWLDPVIIAMLWLPLEFSVGQHWVPKPVQGAVHTAAYGMSITLALWIFLLFRKLDGMKYKLPERLSDVALPLAGFAVAAPILIVLGLQLSFLAPFHVPQNLSLAKLAGRFGVILLATAFPEEILFRGLIQNWLTQRLGAGQGLLIAALIFGSAHLNNAPGPLPNWRYMILATIAGLIYGKVFQKATSVFSSAALHALVNTVRHVFF